MVPNGTTITVEDAVLLFRNFKGAVSEMNDKGKRNFSIRLDDDFAKVLTKDGWNVKQWIRNRGTDEEEIVYHLPVEVGWKARPPRIVLITSGGKTQLDEETVDQLDYVDVMKADLIVRARHWNDLKDGNKTKVKAWLSSIYVTAREDELELKYSDVHNAADMGEEPPF